MNNTKLVNIKDAISTRNTNFVKTGKHTYSLKHYKTEVLRVTGKNIKKMLPVSASSRSAIVQALKYLKMNPKDLNGLCEKLNGGKNIDELQTQWSSKITA